MKTKAQATRRQNQNETAGQPAPSVQERAYELFLQRGQEPGHELEDWLQAEREISRNGHEDA